MILGRFTQQPTESLDYDLDYSEWLSGTDNVKSAVVTVDPAGLTVDAFVNPPRVKLWASGGSNGTNYKVTCTMTTDDGRVKQDELYIKIKEL